MRRQRRSRREQGGSTLDLGPRSAKHLTARHRDASGPRAAGALGGERRVDFAESGPFRLSRSGAGPVVIFRTSPLSVSLRGAHSTEMLRESPHCETPAQGTCEDQGTEAAAEI